MHRHLSSDMSAAALTLDRPCGDQAEAAPSLMPRAPLLGQANPTVSRRTQGAKRRRARPGQGSRPCAPAALTPHAKRVLQNIINAPIVVRWWGEAARQITSPVDGRSAKRI